MQTQFIEFQSPATNAILRGILVIPEQVFAGVVMLHGFERVATTEKKFKALADQLAQKGYASFRFDFSGCGLSDGHFEDTTVQQRLQEAKEATRIFLELTHLKRTGLIGHSLGGCVITELIDHGADYTKVIFLAPAFNQQQLLRYWFVQAQAKQLNPRQPITWSNYKDYLDESAFEQFCNDNHKTLKYNRLTSAYHLENKEKIYGTGPIDQRRVLLIHGTADDKVPLDSHPTTFRNTLEVKGADHDLEHPDHIQQWMDVAIHWLTTA